PDHPLGQTRELELRQLAQYPAVFPGSNTFTHQVVGRLFEQHNLQPRIGMSTNYMETIKMLVSIGLAWSVLPRSMLDSQVRVLQFHVLQPVYKMGCIQHSWRTLSNGG